jgi:hypothetical protein
MRPSIRLAIFALQFSPCTLTTGGMYFVTMISISDEILS